SNSNHNTGFKPIYDVILDSHSKIEQRSNVSSDVTGIATGFTDFDKLTTGLHEDQLIILAARPAMGKTAFALNIAQNVACKSNKPVAIFSLEMGAESLVERMLAAEGTIKSYHIRTGKLTPIEWQRLIYAQGQLAEAPIYIDDTAGIRIAEIRSRARKLAQATGGLGLIVIDYLQLIQGSRSDNRQQEVSEISRQLKIIAKELKVPVIALSQLSRSVEQRQDKRPIMSDLRESGSIEQDADIVAFLYRDNYYQDKKDDQPEKNLTELIIKKNRHGDLGTVKMYFHKEYTKFTNAEE
ncbi:replicative DNA helicase, partial [Streptococcus suis]